MARLLNVTGYWSSVLAAVCLILALVVAPIGEVRADAPAVKSKCPNGTQTDCSFGGNGNEAGCLGTWCSEPVNRWNRDCKYSGGVCYCPT